MASSNLSTFRLTAMIEILMPFLAVVCWRRRLYKAVSLHNPYQFNPVPLEQCTQRQLH